MIRPSLGRAARFLAFGVLGATVLAVAIALVPVPARVARALVTWNADWLLSNYMARPDGAGAYAGNARRKLTALYAQYAVAGVLARRWRVAGNAPDAERIMAVLEPLRRAMLNQNELPHAPAQWSPLFSGVGFCDQMNAVAANVLGQEFASAQIVGLYDPRTRAEHTVGRVWSTREREWLFFDVWGQLTVFRLVGNRPLVVAQRDVSPGAIDSATLAAVRGMYEFAGSARVINEYPPTFAAFLARRAARAMRSSSLASLGPAGGIPIGDAAVAYAARGLPTIDAPTAYRRRYMQVRLEHLLGGSHAAGEYAELAGRHSASLLDHAAARFAARLDTP